MGRQGRGDSHGERREKDKNRSTEGSQKTVHYLDVSAYWKSFSKMLQNTAGGRTHTAWQNTWGCPWAARERRPCPVLPDLKGNPAIHWHMFRAVTAVVLKEVLGALRSTSPALVTVSQFRGSPDIDVLWGGLCDVTPGTAWTLGSSVQAPESNLSPPNSAHFLYF